MNISPSRNVSDFLISSCLCLAQSRDATMANIVKMHEDSWSTAWMYISIILGLYLLGLAILLLHHIKKKHGQLTFYDIYLEVLPSNWNSWNGESSGSKTNFQSEGRHPENAKKPRGRRHRQKDDYLDEDDEVASDLISSSCSHSRIRKASRPDSLKRLRQMLKFRQNTLEIEAEASIPTISNQCRIQAIISNAKDQETATCQPQIDKSHMVVKFQNEKKPGTIEGDQTQPIKGESICERLNVDYGVN
ncbi:hypothetical protein TCAL_02428, partial [Tigriopus californicus]